MGLDDRDYMRDVPIYRDLIGRGGNRPPPSSEASAMFGAPPPSSHFRSESARTRPWGWFGLGAITILAALTLVVARRQGGPAPVAAPFSPAATPAPTAPSFPITGPDRAAVGSVLTLTGSVAAQSTGPVTVQGRWNGGVWVVLATTETVSGTYQVRVPLDQRGVVQLQLALPDGSYGTSTVTVT